MRGGVAVWKRGVGGHGVKAAVAYAVKGACDASHAHEVDAESVIAAAKYAGQTVSRHTVIRGTISRDELDTDQLSDWVKGNDPATGQLRGGRVETSPQANMLYDATINFPKSYSMAGMLHPELQRELDSLMDRIRDKTITVWQSELNARRGAGGLIREGITQLEVVELEHARSRALDPHAHRHTWLSTKVLGEDGKWSNLDSAVMMKMQPLINGYGEVMARTDARWLSTLNRFGLGLDANGEIRELAHLSRPFSKRNDQIARNVAGLVAEWEAAHPGAHPSVAEMVSFDRLAYLKDRPGKPADLDEMGWAQARLAEIAAIDPDIEAVLGERFDASYGPAPVAGVSIGEVDRDLLAVIATVEADARSARSNDRFNMFTLRGSVLNAIARSGVVAESIDDPALVDLAQDVTARAIRDHTTVLVGEGNIPQHIRVLRANTTIQARNELEALYAGLKRPGERVLEGTIRGIDDQVNEHALDAQQCAAAQLIGGTDRLVTVVGPAGAGKTTMLKVARVALLQQGRTMLVVAPAKNAAQVAAAEIGADAGSIHALLHAYGYRWQDAAEGEQWVRLQVGEADPRTGVRYSGVPEHFRLRRGDRVVVDEAGMMDLYTAIHLAEVVQETGAGIAYVGDPRQLDPVGHAGAMMLAARAADGNLELHDVHRFRTKEGGRDTEWAELSLRIREPHNKAEAASIAGRLDELGAVLVAADEKAANELLTGEYMNRRVRGGRVESMVIVAASNEQAATINELIQQARIDAGQIKANRWAFGQNGQQLLVGDRIQVRKNDTGHGVANRENYLIAGIHADGSITARRDGDLQNAGVRLPADYLAENAHLSYAATTHGVQGVTVDRAIVAPGVGGAGAYVGLTRGRYENRILAIAPNQRAAVDEVADLIGQAVPEDTIEESRAAIRAELAAAARDRPVPDEAVFAARDAGDGTEELADQLDAYTPEQRIRIRGGVRQLTAHYKKLADDKANRPATPQPRTPDWETELAAAQRPPDPTPDSGPGLQ